MALHTLCAGPWRLALELPAALDDFATGSQLAATPGQAVLHVTIETVRAPYFPNGMADFQVFDDARCVVRAQVVDIAIDWATGTCVWTWPPVHASYEPDVFLGPSLMGTLQALAMRAGGLMLHGAAVVNADGHAAVVYGPSKAGKSTLCGRFQGRFGHDDSVLLAPDPLQPTRWNLWFQDAFRAPAQAPAALGDRSVVPLDRVLFLGPDRTRTARQPLQLTETYAHLGLQAYYAGPRYADVVSDAVARLAASVPSYALSHCLADDVLLLDHQLFATDDDHA